MTSPILNLAEKFENNQCEGHTTGYPAYFIRLKGCNFHCGIGSKHIKEIQDAGRNNTDSGTFIGQLHKEGSATWTCDTAPLWLFGDKTPFQEIVDDWKKLDIFEWVKEGRVHIIWSGGEPTILKHQKSIIECLDWLHADDKFPQTYNEVETNGSFYLEPKFFEWMQQINCSAKLANSGMSKEKRIVPAALNRIMEHPNYWFKFVISEEKDVEEIIRDYITPFNIPWSRTILMPGLDDREDFHERTRFCLEMAKKYGFIGLTRLHVSCWNKCVGV